MLAIPPLANFDGIRSPQRMSFPIFPPRCRVAHLTNTSTNTMLRPAIALSLLFFAAHPSFAQHSDVFFTYGDTQILIEPQDGRMVIPQIFPDSGFFIQANDNPGFFSETDLVTPSGRRGGTGPGDTIVYNVLDDLQYWSDGEFTAPVEGTEIRIIHIPRSVEDTFVGADSGEMRGVFDPLSNVIGQSDGAGEFHFHVDFRLEPVTSDPEFAPAPGAYGLKLSLSADNDDIAESDPFFITFGFGIDDETFEMALDDFNALLEVSPGIPGDFDGDDLLTAADIDLLSAEVRAGTNAIEFDLSGDDLVTELDRETWVTDLAMTRLGDADLNGTVQVQDFLALSRGFGKPGGWSDGDFDGSGEVQVADFLRLSRNFGRPALTASVPEPGSSSLLLVGLLAVLRCRLNRTEV